MAHFLRDQQITNLSADEDMLRQINAAFESREAAINTGVPADDTTGKRALLTYVIRFDNKGYRVFSLDDLLRYFHQAKDVERVIFTVETGESLRSNRLVGAFLELRLDVRDPNLCLLTVTSNDGDWVEASFSAVQDVLIKCKNKNGWVRTAWTQFAVQMIGVIVGFILSLWAAMKISPKLAIENSFVIAFLFLLLIFSNAWMFLNQRILVFVNGLFPNLKFYRPRKDRVHWLMQAVIGGIALAITLYLLNRLFLYAGEILSGLVRSTR
jgi:hypothetical protein